MRVGLQLRHLSCVYHGRRNAPSRLRERGSYEVYTPR